MHGETVKLEKKSPLPLTATLAEVQILLPVHAITTQRSEGRAPRVFNFTNRRYVVSFTPSLLSHRGSDSMNPTEEEDWWGTEPVCLYGDEKSFSPNGNRTSVLVATPTTLVRLPFYHHCRSFIVQSALRQVHIASSTVKSPDRAIIYCVGACQFKFHCLPFRLTSSNCCLKIGIH
jgi:hypothetical protein